MNVLRRVWHWLVDLWVAITAPRLTFTAAVTCLSAVGFEFEWVWEGVVTRSDGRHFGVWASRGDSETWSNFGWDCAHAAGEHVEALNAARAAETKRIRTERLKAKVASLRNREADRV